MSLARASACKLYCRRAALHRPALAFRSLDEIKLSGGAPNRNLSHASFSRLSSRIEPTKHQSRAWSRNLGGQRRASKRPTAHTFALSADVIRPPADCFYVHLCLLTIYFAPLWPLVRRRLRPPIEVLASARERSRTRTRSDDQDDDGDRGRHNSTTVGLELLKLLPTNLSG